MELSQFLAKLLGIYMLTIATLFALRRDTISDAIKEFLQSRALMFLSGLIALLVGIAIVISHNVWELNWRGLVTFFGYASIAKGVTRIAFPEVPRKAVALLEGPRLWIWFAIVAAIGGYLTWAGFTQVH